MKTVYKHLTALVLFSLLIIMSSALTFSASAASLGNPDSIDDLNAFSRHTTFLEKVDSGYMRLVLQEGSKFDIEYYDNSFNLKSRKSVKMELSVWGGFYNAQDAYYVVEGAANQNNVDGTEVVRVIKYDRNWNKISHASIKAKDDWEYEIGYPFEAGCVEFAEANNKLFIATSRLGYTDPAVGMGHQGMMLIAVDKKTMSSEILYGDFWHSFAQYIEADGNTLFVYEQSEGSGCTALKTFDAARTGTNYFNAATGYTPVFPYGGSRESVWATACYASVDGMELSSRNVIGLGTSIDQSSYDDVSTDTPHNIYLTVTPKNDISYDATKVKWLTDYKNGGKCFTNAKLTKISDDRFLVSWTVYQEGSNVKCESNDSLSGNILHYILIDGNGNTVSKEYTAKAAASNCDPIAVGSKVVFEASCSNMVNFYTIDTETGKLTKKCYRIAGKNATWDIIDGQLVISGTGVCFTDNEVHYVYPLSSTQYGYGYNSDENVWQPIRDRVSSIRIKSGITEIGESQFAYFNEKEVIIENGVSKIGKEAFYCNRELSDITIPASVKNIGDDIIWTGSTWVEGGGHVYRATIQTTKGSSADKYAAKNGICCVYDLSSCKVTIPYSSYTYRGRGIKPTVTVVDSDGSKLKKNTDYTVSYSNNKNIGTAVITVTGIGDYDGTLKKTFTVKPLDLNSSYAKVTVPYSSYTYSGSAVTPKLTVKFKDGDVIPADQYTLSYSNNIRVGVAMITVKGKSSNVTGTYKKTFVVKPAKNEITSISSTKGAFKISWKKGTAGTVGYQVLYSKDKNFKNDVHSYTSTDLSDLSENFSKVPNSGETWYVKVRSFYTKDGNAASTRYGNYSNVRSITVK